MWAYEQLSGLGDGAQLTPPNRAYLATVQAHGVNVRFRLDGQTPDNTHGQVLVADGDILELDGESMAGARFFEATNGATVEVQYKLSRV